MDVSKILEEVEIKRAVLEKIAPRSREDLKILWQMTNDILAHDQIHLKMINDSLSKQKIYREQKKQDFFAFLKTWKNRILERLKCRESEQ